MRSIGKLPIWRDERGATAIEYALIAAAMGIMLITSFPYTSNGVKTVLLNVGNLFNHAAVSF